MATRGYVKKPRFDEDVCRQFCSFLRSIHQPHGLTELVAIGPLRRFLVGWFDDAEAMVAAMRSLPAGFEGYYGLNPRRLSMAGTDSSTLLQRLHRATKVDVVAMTLVLVDIDVVSPERKQSATKGGVGKAPCTDDEHFTAVSLARRIRDELFPDAWLVTTNGAQLVLPVQLPATVADLRCAEAAHKVILRETARRAGNGDFGMAVDLVVDCTVYDLPRIAAMPGTVKQRGTATRVRRHRPIRIEERGSDRATPRASQVLLSAWAAVEAGPGALANLCCGPLAEPASTRQRILAPVDLQPLPELCAGWNRVYTEVGRARSGGRSAVLKALISCFVIKGIDREFIHALVFAHDAAHGGKLAEQYCAESYIDREVDGEAELASCDWVVDCIGSADQCLGCSRYRGKSKVRRGPAQPGFPLLSSPPPRPEGALDDGRQVIAAGLADYLAHPPEGRALLVKGPPGIGKTTMMVKEVQDIIDRGGRALIVVDRIELLVDLQRKLDRPDHVAAILGKRRSAGEGDNAVQLCSQPERLDRADQLGMQSMEGSVACRTCPAKPGCRYWAQFSQTGKTWVTTAAMLHRLIQDKQVPNGAGVVFLDEGARQAFTPDPIRVAPAALSAARPLWRKIGLLAPDAGCISGRAYVEGVARSLAEEGAGVGVLHAVRSRFQSHNDGVIAGAGGQCIAASVIALLWVLNKELRAVGPNSAITVEADRTLVMRRPFVLDLLPSIAVVALDGTGNESVYQTFLGREILVVDPRVKRQADVFQLATGLYGKSTLTQDSRSKELLLAQTIEIVRKRGTRAMPVTVVVFSRMEADVKVRLAGFHCIILHYWATRGSNVPLESGSRDIILVGTPSPNSADIVAWAEARAIADSNPVRSETHLQLQRFGLPTNDLACPVWHFADPRCDNFLQMEREGELRQAAERVRTVIDCTPGKTVWLLTSMPIPGLEPDRLFKDVSEILGNPE